MREANAELSDSSFDPSEDTAIKTFSHSLPLTSYCKTFDDAMYALLTSRACGARFFSGVW
ncbi:hypothetical protein KSD_88660 [Ktedonobacter sp. SOSP1-85]|nr:hypothetical protein KSD_88660 [Ktedonobacter sp. SOSP1-85]